MWYSCQNLGLWDLVFDHTENLLAVIDWFHLPMRGSYTIQVRSFRLGKTDPKITKPRTYLAYSMKSSDLQWRTLRLNVIKYKYPLIIALRLYILYGTQDMLYLHQIKHTVLTARVIAYFSRLTKKTETSQCITAPFAGNTWCGTLLPWILIPATQNQ